MKKIEVNVLELPPPGYSATFGVLFQMCREALREQHPTGGRVISIQPPQAMSIEEFLKDMTVLPRTMSWDDKEYLLKLGWELLGGVSGNRLLIKCRPPFPEWTKVKITGDGTKSHLVDSRGKPHAVMIYCPIPKTRVRDSSLEVVQQE